MRAAILKMHQKKPFHCLQWNDYPQVGRIHVSGDVQQVFKDSIDYVDKVEVSETLVSN